MMFANGKSSTMMDHSHSSLDDSMSLGSAEESVYNETDEFAGVTPQSSSKPDIGKENDWSLIYRDSCGF